LLSGNTPLGFQQFHLLDLYYQEAPVLIYLGVTARGEWALSLDRITERKNKREELARLKRAALAELERRGYEVRGKTPGQIREMLKRRPKKSRAN
jgi:hypothetical protein